MRSSKPLYLTGGLVGMDDTAADPVESWDLPPIPSVETTAAALEEEEESFSFVPCFRLLPARTESPVHIPPVPGVRPALPLLLTYSRISLYHKLIGFSGDDNADRPETLQDAAALLFLSAHHHSTWCAPTGDNPPLRENWTHFWCAIEEWADLTFGISDASRRTVLLIARRLWDHHCRARPIPQKKTRIRETTSPALFIPGPRINSPGSLPEETCSAGVTYWTASLSGMLTPPFTAGGWNVTCPSPPGPPPPSPAPNSNSAPAA